jgi:hypothetical protein
MVFFLLKNLPYYEFLDGSAISSGDCFASLHHCMLLLVLANHIQSPDLTPKYVFRISFQSLNLLNSFLYTEN